MIKFKRFLSSSDDDDDDDDNSSNQRQLHSADSQQLFEHQFRQQPHPQQQQQQQQPQPQNQQPPNQQQSQQQQQQQPQNQQQGDNKPKRNPFCSRCRNHGRSAQVKGHKRHCEYRDCQCDGCKLVEMRQIVSAEQIKRRRYQKQDEESGRRIEISPPVLTCELNSAPAALIAKTLIRSSKRIPQNIAASKHLSELSATHHQNSNNNTSTNNNQLQHPHHHRQPLHPAASLAAAAAAAAAATSLENHHHHHNNTSTTSATNNHRLHLFPFPSSVLSAAAAASLVGFHGQQAAPVPAGEMHGGGVHMAGGVPQLLVPVGTTTTTTVSSGSLASAAGAISSPTVPMPSFREQIALVEEIDQSFGPLAIYAWLKAEHFNFKKIRDLIELSKVSFDELLQITGHSPLDLTSPIVD